MDQAQQLSQKVEKEVRQLIGDLQMQIIVLRGMIELSQQPAPQPGQQPVPGQPPRNPEPQPVPGQEPLPPPPQPNPAPSHKSGNGRAV